MSEKSEKRLDRCRPGDFLFFSSEKGLNLDFDGKIIAQFVDKIRGTYRFCSIKYMSRVTPYSGSTLPYMHLKFGNFKVQFEDLADDDMLRNDGALMTAAFAKKLNIIGYVGPRKMSVVPDDASQYHSPLYMATLLYKTPGTKSGDWYVPSHSELDMIFRNKDVINLARNSEHLEEIADFFYFTCNEESDVDCEMYDMDDGNAYIASKRLAKIDNQEETCAIAFLQMTE